MKYLKTFEGFNSVNEESLIVAAIGLLSVYGVKKLLQYITDSYEQEWFKLVLERMKNSNILILESKEFLKAYDKVDGQKELIFQVDKSDYTISGPHGSGFTLSEDLYNMLYNTINWNKEQSHQVDFSKDNHLKTSLFSNN